MDRGVVSRLLTGMLVPVSLVLVLSALSQPRQAFTGLVLRDDWVADVVPGSPAADAGFARGDRIVVSGNVLAGPLELARAGTPIALLRERAGALHEVRLVPAPLPDGEWRVRAALLIVASGFVILGGWVWSERRDRLTRSFLLLCLAFALLVAPWPKLPTTWTFVYDALYAAVTLMIPALFVHFFALFPASERPRGRRRALTRAAYGVSGALVLATVALAALAPLANVAARSALSLVQALAGLWFALGLLIAVALFARSYVTARSDDARRRLRVALVGTVLGVIPFSVLVGMRNLFPAAPLPGERWALALTLLVPASFAWAIAVHRVFEIRMALRVAVVCAAAAVLAGIVFGVGEWLAAVWRPDLGHGIAGGALAFVALTASAAGPASRWAREMGERLVPEREGSPLDALERDPALRAGTAAEIVSAACTAMVDALMLDGALAIEQSEGGARIVACVRGMDVPALVAPFAPLLPPRRPIGLEEAPLDPLTRGALQRAGVRWVLALGGAPAIVFLLGRRLAGSWLSTADARELSHAAAHLEVLLDNARLRGREQAHVGLDRELTRAGAIQARLLPREAPASRMLDCAAASLSCEAVGGDYYDFVQGDGAALTLAVGDAAGKGVPAALMGTWAQACFRSHARLGAAPAAVLEALNRELVAMEQPDAFVALLCARVEPERARFSFANAGLPPPLLVRRDGTVEELAGGGVLLGVTPHARYGDLEVALEDGELVLLYTDGLTEARRGDELFGTWRVMERLARDASGPASGLVHALIEEARAFSDKPLDDITIVALRQVGHTMRPASPGLQTALKFPGIASDT